MKKFVCLILALSLSMFAIGCGGDTKKPPEKKDTGAPSAPANPEKK